MAGRSSSDDSDKGLRPTGDARVPLPRIAIKFCVQCKWNLRAAYFAQELLSTFSTSLGEVSLIPATGGVFTVTMLHVPSTSILPVPTSSAFSTPSNETVANAAKLEAEPNTNTATTATETLLWDRKAEGGFPETKELKNRVRNIIEPGRDLGHIDRSLKKGLAASAAVAGGNSSHNGATTATATHVGDGSARETGNGVTANAKDSAEEGGRKSGQEKDTVVVIENGGMREVKNVEDEGKKCEDCQ